LEEERAANVHSTEPPGFLKGYVLNYDAALYFFTVRVEPYGLLPTNANASPKQHSSEYNSHDDKNPSVHGRASA
jgi:hypothetical protein